MRLPAGSGQDAAGGGSLTTVEGLLESILEKLESLATMSDGDSEQQGSFTASMRAFLAGFRNALVSSVTVAPCRRGSNPRRSNTPFPQD